MAEALVLDASAVCKLVRLEPESDAVHEAVRKQLEAGGRVWTDSLATIEIVTCARDAVRRGEADLDTQVSAIEAVFKVVQRIERKDSSKELRDLLRLAVETGLTGADATYVQLARGQRLLTFDAKQARAAIAQGIQPP